MATASSLAWFFTNSAGLLVSRRSRSIAIRKTTTKRSAVQKEAFTAASVEFAREVIARGASVLVVGDDRGPNFPADLRSFRARTGAGIKVNLLMNYDWQWDLDGLRTGELRSRDVSKLDLIVRWGADAG